jgi:hypothetical protein
MKKKQTFEKACKSKAREKEGRERNKYRHSKNQVSSAGSSDVGAIWMRSAGRRSVSRSLFPAHVHKCKQCLKIRKAKRSGLRTSLAGAEDEFV